MVLQEFECLGGPMDGRVVALPHGASTLCAWAGEIAHSYRLAPVDGAMELLYDGPSDWRAAACSSVTIPKELPSASNP
jgi:hypothetical protein